MLFGILCLIETRFLDTLMLHSEFHRGARDALSFE